MLRCAKRQRVPVIRIHFIDAQRRLSHATLQAIPRSLIVLPDRPGRREPRVCKRRPKRYCLMTKPRPKLQQDLIRKQLV